MEILTSEPDSVRTSTAHWQTLLRDSWRDFGALCEELGLSQLISAPSQKTMRQFRLFAPKRWIDRIERGNLQDPLLLQIMPSSQEDVPDPSFVLDPVGDRGACRGDGLLQKYEGRALVVMTGACAIHCRYCFRRHFDYQGAINQSGRWDRVIADIAADQSLTEVILSGGDPLMIVDDLLSSFIEEVGRIDHLQRLRIHTRMPIVLPERITTDLIESLRASRLTSVVVVHANHAMELDKEVSEILRRLGDSGIMVFNQAVLLKGINNNIDAQIELSQRLIDARTVPYYLHQLDRVDGATHFEVPLDEALALYDEMRKRLPGYAVPRLVQEVEGSPYKELLVG